MQSLRQQCRLAAGLCQARGSLVQGRPRRQPLYLAPPFLVGEDYEPLARRTHRAGLMPAKVEAAHQELTSCMACPRNCKVNRMDNQKGVCHTGRYAIGWNGSGTIFFGMCNLRCVFCQNWDISQKKAGWESDAEEIADIMLKLQDEGRCHNINFVTPEHVVPQIVEAIAAATDRGLNLPIVYNTSSYDSLRSLKLLEGLVDIYMPDFKFWTSETSQRLCKAKDYPEVTKEVIKEMYRQVGDLVFSPNGLAKRGLLVRHLVLPSYVHEGKEIMKFLAEEVSRDTYVNIMEQYRPAFTVGKGEMRTRSGFTTYEEIDRYIEDSEVEELRRYAKKKGLWRFEDNLWLERPISY